MSSGVHWGASSGLPADHPHTAAAAGPAGRPGSQTAAVWRLTWHCRATQHYCGPGKDSSALLLETASRLNLCASMDIIIFGTYTSSYKSI